MTDATINAQPAVYTRAQMIELLLALPDTIGSPFLEHLSTGILAEGLTSRHPRAPVRETARATRAALAGDHVTLEEAPGAGVPAIEAAERVAAVDEARAAAVATDAATPASQSADEDSDDKAPCDMCGENFAPDVLRPVLRFSDHRRDCTVTMHVCESCGDGDDDLRPGTSICVTGSQARHARGTHGIQLAVDAWYANADGLTYNEDSAEWGTGVYAGEYWHMHDSDGCWHSDAEDFDEDSDEDDDSCFDYSADIFDHLHWPDETPGESLCYGVELEIESKEDSSSQLAAALGGREGERHILKYDGSLNHGAEIVTLPYSLDFHREHFGWRALLAKAEKAGNSHNTGTCGMHVHINRAALKPLQLGKMLVFVNAPGNEHYIKQIAQRDPSRWAAFKEKTLTDGSGVSPSRYEAINVSQRTAEIRIFRGNLRLDRVMKNLEFCDALVHFCATSRPARLQWKHFAYWLSKTTREYPNLRAFIAEHVTPAPDAEKTEIISEDSVEESIYAIAATTEEI